MRVLHDKARMAYTHRVSRNLGIIVWLKLTWLLAFYINFEISNLKALYWTG